MLDDAQLLRIETELAECYERLVGYAMNVAQRTNRRRPGGIAGGDIGPDLLHEAVVTLYSEARTWNDALAVEQFLEGAVRSVAYSRRKARASQEQSYDARVEKLGSAADVATPGSPEPELRLANRQTLERALAMFAGDARACQVITAIHDGAIPPREIAEDTGLTVAQVKEVRRRLKARLGPVFELDEEE